MKTPKEWLPIIGAIIIAVLMVIAVSISAVSPNIQASGILVGIASILAFALCTYVISHDSARTIGERRLLIFSMGIICISIIVLLIVFRTPYNSRSR